MTGTTEGLQRIINTVATRSSAATAVLLMALVGCAPGTPDDDSWRDDATRAVGDVLSAVQTARLGIEQAQDDRVPDAYLQTVLVDAERTGGMAASTLSSVQPPDSERRRSSDVTDRLDRATGLLSDARIAVVARDTHEYGDLVAELRNTAHDLVALEVELEHP